MALSSPPSDEGGGFCEAKDGGREIDLPPLIRHIDFLKENL